MGVQNLILGVKEGGTAEMKGRVAETSFSRERERAESVWKSLRFCRSADTQRTPIPQRKRETIERTKKPLRCDAFVMVVQTEKNRSCHHGSVGLGCVAVGYGLGDPLV